MSNTLDLFVDDYLNLNNDLETDIDRLFESDLGLNNEWNLLETDGDSNGVSLINGDDYLNHSQDDNDDGIDLDSNYSSLSPSSQDNQCQNQQELNDEHSKEMQLHEFDDDNLALIDDLISKNLSSLTDNNNVLIDENIFENVVEVGTSSLVDLNDNSLISNLSTNESDRAELLKMNENSDDDDEMDDEDEDYQYLSPAESIEIHHNYCYNKRNSLGSVTNSPNGRKKGNSSVNSATTGTTGRINSRSKGHVDIVLTEEEIRLLNKEGYKDFPSGSTPLTKQEEKILRKIRRKIRNKRSAQCSRQRKKEYLDDLERRYEKCSSDNLTLRKENLKLKKNNDSLLVKIKKLLMLTNLANGQASFKTSFLVLILSFLLVIFPYFRPESIDDNYIGLINEKAVIGTGRQLLHALNINDSDAVYNYRHSIYYGAGADLNETLTSFLDYTSDINAF